MYINVSANEHEMITLKAFNQLSKFQQCALLWQEGIFMSNRFSRNGFSINLYHAGNFYAEVWYNGNTKQVGSIRTFRNLNKLEPYLDSIDIKDVLP
jgi:hypothetical protein